MKLAETFLLTRATGALPPAANNVAVQRRHGARGSRQLATPFGRHQQQRVSGGKSANNESAKELP